MLSTHFSDKFGAQFSEKKTDLIQNVFEKKRRVHMIEISGVFPKFHANIPF